MNVKLPKSDQHPLVKVTVKTPKQTLVHTLDDSHGVLPINLPAGVSAEEVDIIAEFCDSRGRVDDRARPVVLQAAAPAQKAAKAYGKPQAAPKVESKAEPKGATPSPPTPAAE